MPLPKYAIVVAARSFLAGHPRLCASLLLLAFATLCIVSTYHNTPTVDEPAHLAFGEKVIDGTLDHGDMQRMPITALNVLPKKVLQAFHVSLSRENGRCLSRLPTVIASVVLGWFVFFWSRKRYGTRGGLISLFLYVFCPTALAHGGLATTDMYCALFSFLAVFAFVLYMKTRSWQRLLVAAALMGTAQLTKHTALWLFPVLLTVSILREYATRSRRRVGARPWWRRRIPRDTVHGLSYLLVTLAIINSGYRFRGTFETLATHKKWLQANQGYQVPAPGSGGLGAKLNEALSRVPLPLPRSYVEPILLGQYYNRTGEGHGPIYLLGKRSQFGWPYYFLVALALKIPLPTLGLIILASFACIRARRLRLASDEFVLLCSASALFVSFSLLCTAQIGIRYLLPMLPFLYVFAGQLGVWSSGFRSGLGKVCRLTLFLWLPVSVLSYFPHFIPYFNEICWNRLRLYEYLADSNLDWEQSGDYVDRYVRSHKGQSITINPVSRTTGTVIVAANSLVGIAVDPATYQWLRDNYVPTGHVGYAWLVYQIPDQPNKPSPTSTR